MKILDYGKIHCIREKINSNLFKLYNFHWNITKNYSNVIVTLIVNSIIIIEKRCKIKWQIKSFPLDSFIKLHVHGKNRNVYVYIYNIYCKVLPTLTVQFPEGSSAIRKSRDHSVEMCFLSLQTVWHFLMRWERRKTTRPSKERFFDH